MSVPTKKKTPLSSSSISTYPLFPSLFSPLYAASPPRSFSLARFLPLARRLSPLSLFSPPVSRRSIKGTGGGGMLVCRLRAEAQIPLLSRGRWRWRLEAADPRRVADLAPADGAARRCQETVATSTCAPLLTAAAATSSSPPFFSDGERLHRETWRCGGGRSTMAPCFFTRRRRLLLLFFSGGGLNLALNTRAGDKRERGGRGNRSSGCVASRTYPRNGLLHPERLRENELGACPPVRRRAVLRGDASFAFPFGTRRRRLGA